MILHKVLHTQWNSNHLSSIIEKTVKSPAWCYKFKTISHKVATQYLTSVTVLKRHKDRVETLFISQMTKCNLSDIGLIFCSTLHLLLMPTSTRTQIICLLFSQER